MTKKVKITAKDFGLPENEEEPTDSMYKFLIFINSEHRRQDLEYRRELEADWGPISIDYDYVDGYAAAR